ncbi:MAG: hypothetical protein GY803_19890 [Chloroflexi bacterium]|nr:hypothetical protein [Chloroflexota bacterium]
MLNAIDLAKMKADLSDVISDNSASIVIRRGETTLAAQTVRVERGGIGRSNKRDAAHAEQTESRITVAGGVDLDIALGDRFNAHGFLYEATAVHPNTQMGKLAEAILVQ